MTKAIAKTYRLQFIAWANENNVEIGTDEFMAWDEQVNHGAVKAEIIAKHGKDAIYAAGLREMFNRYLYNPGIVKMAPSKNNPTGFKTSGLPSTSLIRGGVYIPTASPESMAVLIEAQKVTASNALLRLKFYKMPVPQIVAWVESILED